MSFRDIALGRAARFLLDRQDADGGWRDFQLRRGAATSWTTAYVAARLAEVPELDPRILAALDAAEAFLRRHREPGGGWGYNERCMADADSTALALLFLAPRSSGPPLKDVAVLASFQNPDGGFATYRHLPADHPWSASNPELTPTVLRALALFLPVDHLILRRGRGWVLKAVQAGPAAAYWWATPAYMLLELARIGLRLPGVRADSLRTAGAFEAALALEARARLGGSSGLRRETEALIEAQRADGSWPPSPMLRVPGPDIRLGSKALDEVTPNIDVRGLFTTATVLSALLRAPDPRLVAPAAAFAPSGAPRDFATFVPQ